MERCWSSFSPAARGPIEPRRLPETASNGIFDRRTSTTNEGVEQLLSELQTDRAEVETADVEALEVEIDEAAYDLFDLTEDEREVIEEYLEVF